MKVSALILSLFFSIASFAAPRQDVEKKIIADTALSLSRIKSPTEALEKLKPRLSESEVRYLESLIQKKLWVEMPEVASEDQVINYKFSDGTKISVEITDYFRGEFLVNGHKIEVDRYKSLEEKMSYLRRLVSMKLLPTKSKGAGLWSLFFPYAQASLTCNMVVSSGCLEVSMAASLWLVREASSESPLARCRDNYYFNKNQDMTKKCLSQYGNSQALSSIQEISEMLAQTPKSTVEITCNKGEGPHIWINGEEVTRFNKGHSASDYSVTMAQDPQVKLNKLPAAVIRCCQKPSGDPLAGECESFVNEHLGSKEKRAKEFSGSNVRLRGKALEGTR
ncbi:hypothetical protein AZI87_03645 [Bdellovibrio bacteriovorus]|uniref:Uncharacterized protein n=1 Tax=Bdellovibrio bacteriovorus TaxID=959 RepID=A0A162GK88_BDEBC|nr:hypothetical protein [Bdellovibrio bacteriovorus]KYG68359.1 hypothetical protein AZI87_03645 [Bdellovibrio bacteriovorus]